MRIITLDFETYYDREFSLSKITTEEYVRDDRFEVIGISYKIDDEPARWITGTFEYIKASLEVLPWKDSFALAHNAMFDAAILTWRFGITPMAWLDTLSMARAIHGTEIGNSLAKLVEYYSLGRKGTEVVDALGVRKKDFTDDSLRRYGEYCKNDTELTYKLFNILVQHFKKPELKLIDLTIRMFSEPVLELDTPLLEAHLLDVQNRKELLMEKISADKDSLMSNLKFAELLRERGVEPPTKISLTTGKETLALAKSDEGFKALAEHPDEYVQALVAARLGNKSTLEETRTERFLSIAKRGAMPVPLQYYAAHTGRWGGTDKINLQNLPSRGKDGKKLKMAIKAPKGYVVIDSDSSQIEARVLAWMAGQNDLIEAFKNKEDVYKIMASAIYRKKVDDITKEERFVGKTTILGCIGSGTMVLCDSGWKAIESVTLIDKLWDGKEWVCHQGLVPKGLKETLNLCGIWLTPDHKILSGTQWLEAQSVAQDESILYRALDTGAENLPLQVTSREKGWAFEPLLLNATAKDQNIRSTSRILKILKVLDVTFALSKRHIKRGIGNTLWLCKKMIIELGYLTGYPRLYLDAITHKLLTTQTMGVEVYKYAKLGETIERHSSPMYKRLVDGTYQSLKWIGLITAKAMNLITYGLFPEVITCVTKEESLHLRKNLQTYDIVYAGPRNRFTVLTEQGPMIVHNCGYGMGSIKFKTQLKGFGAEIEDAEAKHIISVYRDTYKKIPELWKESLGALNAIMDNQTKPLGNGAVVVKGRDGILMPNGLYQRYPNLRKILDDDGKEQYVYDAKRGAIKIYGGKLVENICQGVARCIIGEQMVKIAKRYKVVLTVHDAIASVVREEEVEEALAYVEECMRWTPDWAEGLSLNCEAGHGNSYGDC